ncbi:hypothetical protein GGX14DRAFT_387341 [Mycena pura]|uniref:Uncharacterized protein n=1 Tax=Mycena pura TaxID=153505 RepID=A0AAD6YNR4_9AGAR|nr:hypothetical protein GGX14DRAFT_387341 [Mycena pura]
MFNPAGPLLSQPAMRGQSKKCGFLPGSRSSKRSKTNAMRTHDLGAARKWRGPTDSQHMIPEGAEGNGMREVHWKLAQNCFKTMPAVDTDVLEREEVGSSGCMLVPRHRNQSEPAESVMLAKFWPRRTRDRYSGCYSPVVNGALEIEAHDIHAEACGDEQPAKVQEVSTVHACDRILNDGCRSRFADQTVCLEGCPVVDHDKNARKACFKVNSDVPGLVWPGCPGLGLA